MIIPKKANTNTIIPKYSSYLSFLNYTKNAGKMFFLHMFVYDISY